MGLETSFTYIDNLDTANPNGSPDQLAQADDHLRGIKTAVKGSFPSLGAEAVTKTAAEINDLVDKSTTQTIAGAKTFNDFTGTGSLTGNAATATAFSASGTLNATGGDITGSASSANGNYTVNLQIGANKVGANEIAAGAVGNSEVADNTMRFSNEMLTSTTGYTWATALNTGAGVAIARGVYVVYSTAANFQITALINGVHRVIYTGGGGDGVFVVSNGAVQYSSNDGSTATGYATRMYQ